jgi:hypothetical protein
MWLGARRFIAGIEIDDIGIEHFWHEPVAVQRQVTKRNKGLTFQQ